MIKFLLAALLAVVFTSCTSTHAHISEYRIAPEVNIKALQQGKCADKTIKVGQTFSSSLYRRLDMNYAQDGYKLDTYTESQWAISLNHAVNAQLVNMLNASNIFKSVQVSKSRSSSNYILETNIENFMQYFDSSAKKSTVKVKISMTLIDSRSTKVVASKIFMANVPSKELDADGGVKALNIALGNVLVDSSLWLEAVCK